MEGGEGGVREFSSTEYQIPSSNCTSNKHICQLHQCSFFDYALLKQTKKNSAKQQ